MEARVGALHVVFGIRVCQRLFCRLFGLGGDVFGHAPVLRIRRRNPREFELESFVFNFVVYGVNDARRLLEAGFDVHCVQV